MGICPSTVRFICISDEDFMLQWKAGEIGADWGCPHRRFDAINCSYGLVRSKAVSLAKCLLADGGSLLAPVHRGGGGAHLDDAFVTLDASGAITCEEGGWQIEPDVTDQDPEQQVRREGMLEATRRSLMEQGHL